MSNAVRFFIGLSVCGGLLATKAVAQEQADGSGRIQVTPDTARVVTTGDWAVNYIVSAVGLRPGGGVQVRFGFGQPQAHNPDSSNYVYAATSRPGVHAQVLEIKDRDRRLGWDHNNYAWIVSVAVDGEMVQGDTLFLVFQGFRPSFSSFDDEILATSDVDGDGTYARLEAGAFLSIRPWKPYRIQAFMPSTLWVGESFQLRTVAFDIFDNIASSFQGTIFFVSTDPLAALPQPYTFSRADSGIRRFPVVFWTPGIHRIEARVMGVEPDSLWRVWSNPFEVFEEEPTHKLYWGDLHSHSAISVDGQGRDPFQYALWGSNLDFYAPTEHTGDQELGTTEEEWESLKQDVIAYNQPGQFVTLLGYEFSAGSPYGHHNVYFDAGDDLIPLLPIWRTPTFKSTPNLWAALDAELPSGVLALTIPHHTGMVSNETQAYVSFGEGYAHEHYRRSIEIYSNHGTSEYFDPAQPLAYERLHDEKKWSYDGPHYARDAWAIGEKLGVIASTDDHTARPGLQGKGLAAVYAPALQRKDIFDALNTRYSYGTTGERILLDFTIDRVPMGGEVFPKRGEYPELSIRVAGTNTLEFVEVLKWGLDQGLHDETPHPQYEVVARRVTPAEQVSFSVIDSTFSGSSLYYVRVKQQQGVYSNRDKTTRETWAWSSPIWVTRAGVTETESLREGAPDASMELHQYPNPSGGSFTVEYTLLVPGAVKISLFDLLGREVRVLLDKEQMPGRHVDQFLPMDLASGVYILRLQARGQSMTRNVVMIP